MVGFLSWEEVVIQCGRLERNGFVVGRGRGSRCCRLDASLHPHSRFDALVVAREKRAMCDSFDRMPVGGRIK